MKKFWKIYSWIYLGVALFGVIHYVLNPIEIEVELNRTIYFIAYTLLSLLWLMAVVGLFLYSFNKRKFMIFWKLYFLYFAYILATMIIESCKTGEVKLLVPFHAIALVGLFLYSFTKK